MITKLPNKLRMTGLFFLSMLMMSSGLVRAQGANTYTFTSTTGTYTPISGTSSSASGDDGTQNNLPIGFTFDYGGNQYTTFCVTTNGFLKLGGTITTGTANYTNNIHTATNAPLIAAFWDDNNLTGGNIQYLTSGSPGSQTLTVQWTNVHIGNGGSTSTPTMSFQIILYETSNQIDIIYNGASAALISATGAIGLATASGNYLSVTPGTPPTTSTTTPNNGISSATNLPSGTVYTFNPPPPCAGQPPFGQTTASVLNACTNTPFTLGVSGVPSQIGLTYEFYSSPMGLNNFTSLGAPQSSPNFTVTNQTSPTDYQVVVTCTGSSLFATASMINVGQNPFYNCYCTPVSNCTNEGIENVTFDVINNTTGKCTNTSGYSDYSTLTPMATVTQGQQIAMSVTAWINSNPAGAGVWIDYNHSGTFDPAEFTLLGTTTSFTGTAGQFVFAAPVTIDINALTGITRMRVRSANSTTATQISATTPCLTTNAYGEYEDYLININAASTCTGTPNVVTVTSSSTSVCPSKPFTLNASGASTGLGITYEWQYDDGTGFQTLIDPTTSLPASSLTYTVTSGITVPTQFRFITTCTSPGGGSTTSSPIALTINPFMSCYCIPTGGASTTYGINNFSTSGGFTNISNLGSGPSVGGYTDYSSTMTLATAPNSIIGISGSGMGTGTYGWAVWVDWDQNGSFDASEKMYNTTSYTNTIPAAVTFTVPATALPGNTRMRVVANFNNSNPSSEQCGATSGTAEWEDYMVNIGAPPTCLAPAILATSGVTTSSADINWTPSTSNPGIGYEYYYSTSNTPPTAATTPLGAVGNTASTANLTGLNGSTTYYFWVRSHCSTNDYSAWAGGSFMTLLSNDLPSGALPITLGAGCTTFNNIGGSFTAGEPAISCRGTNINTGAAVWFKFVAPLSGMVKVSTDGATTSLDTKLGVFTTSNPSDPTDLASFSILACDDDNGITYGTSSTSFVSGLTPGVTYYIAVDHYNGGSTGNFCVSVDDVTTTMISPTGACLQSSETPYSREDFTGWATIVDAQGRLIANVRRLVPTGNSSVFNYTGRLNVNTGAVRQAGTDYYLDRNFSFAYSQNPAATTFDVRLYFLNTELSALQAVDPNASLANLNVTHQTGTSCAANYTVAGGTNTVLLQSANGSGNGLSWIEVNTPGFSNFYIMSGISPLKIDLASIRATNLGSSNRIDWTTAAEKDGDRFELERSTDGEHFIKLADLNAKGTLTTYSYIDERAVTGINYYRVKLVDATGSFAYSDVVSATVKAGISFDVEVYPNPVSDKIHVRVNGVKAGNASVQVLDITGRIVKAVGMTGNTSEIDITQLPSGAYFVKYNDDSHSKTQKITKH